MDTVLYTLQEIEDLIKQNQITSNNFTDVVASLMGFNYTPEVREVLINLSDIEFLPDRTKVELKRLADSKKIIDKVPRPRLIKKDNIEEKSDNNGSNDTTVEVISSKQEEKVDQIETVDFSDEEIKGTTISTNQSDTLETYPSFKNLDLKIVEIKNGTEIENGLRQVPHITFEITPESKPYIDNLMLNLYNNDAYGLDFVLTWGKVESANKELLNIGIDNNDLSLEESMEKSANILSTVDKILRETKKDVNYESKMPLALREIKSRFINDDPDVANKNFRIVYKNQNSENTFFLIANSKETAKEIADEIGYELKETNTNGTFEIDTSKRKHMSGTKIEQGAEPISTVDDNKDYRSEHFEIENTKRIREFISNTDPSNISVVEVNIPESDRTKRLVTLNSNDGTRENIIYSDSKDFDNSVLPVIAQIVGQNTQIKQNGIYNLNYKDGYTDYEVATKNTILRINHFPTEATERVSTYFNTVRMEVPNNKDIGNITFQKNLGTYPTSNKEAAKTSFISILVFIGIFGVGLLLIYIYLLR